MKNLIAKIAASRPDGITKMRCWKETGLKRAEVWTLVKVELARQEKIRANRNTPNRHFFRWYGEKQNGEKYGYGEKISMLQVFEAAATARREKAAQLASARRNREAVAAQEQNAAALLAGAIDLVSAETAFAAELARLKNETKTNGYGDYSMPLPLGSYLAGPRHAHGVRVTSCDGFSGGGKYGYKPIKHVHHVTSATLDALAELVKKFTPKTLTVLNLPKVVKAAAMGWQARGSCRKCGDSDHPGTIYHHRHDRMEQCPQCGGTGERTAARVTDYKAANAALELFKNGASVEKMLEAVEQNRSLPTSDPTPDPDAIADIAADLGLRGDSTLAVAVFNGSMDMERAQAIAAKTRFRHENTNYDSLLSQGYDRDDARAMMEAVA